MRSLSCIIFVLFITAISFAQSPHGDKLKIDCANCHEPTDWKIIPKEIKFDHNKETSFKLMGQHASVSCESCHKSLIFSDVKSECVSCHKDIHQNTLGPDCARCHTPASWVVTNIIQIHQNSRFPLLGVHMNVDCASCHSGFAKLYFPPQDVSCFSCHKQQYYAAKNPDHVAANFSTNCQDCHSITGFAWASTNFDHSFFPLVGGHNTQNCFSCHKSGSNFKGLTTACYPCHQNDYMQAKNPDHVAAKFSTNCQDCHAITTFTTATFNHSTTGFPLTGAHASVTCQQCHSTGYTNTSTDCYSCHNQDFASTTNPNHIAGGFPHNCVQCHSTINWSGATFDHSTTGFPLTGGHATVQCAQCHASGYINTPTDCYSCHANTYNTATAPTNHAAAGLPHTCQDCHNTTAWTTTTFNHTTTGFTLTGAHTTLDCSSCHKGAVTGLTTDCYTCHSADFAGTTNPNHVTGGFPHDCSQCHSTTSWNGATFNHNATGFPLTGAHATVQCAQCHASGYTNTPTDCYSCHASTYNTATAPTNHPAAGLPHTCQDCHNTTAWTTTTFNHTTTGFTLTGAHTTLDCSSCHKGAVTGLTPDCYSCHSTDFAGTTNPNHVTGGFPHDCSQCHSTTNWSGATFDHSTTGFPLTGAHATVQCAQCHASGYTNTPADCYSCHASTYNTATAPTNHPAAGLPHTCQDCHNTTAWTTTTFNHTTTGFTLTGAHTTLDCSSCHKGTVTGLTTDCYSCHSTDFAGTTNPNHVTQGFPHDCSQCHSTTSWSGATFDHSTTGFPLTGAHASVQCAQCHASGYTSTPTACYSCHQNDYNGTTNPAHQTAGFPTDCTQCHNTTAWQPSTFNHDASYFPIYSGNHAGRWTLCSDCHSSASNFAVFTCITCHQHSQANTDPHHSGVRNYVYSATSCYSCHPRGSGG